MAKASGPKGPRSRDRFGEAHLGGLRLVELLPHVKASADPPGSESGTRLGIDLRDAPQPGLLRQARKVLEERTP